MNGAATFHKGACTSPELRFPEEMVKWGSEGAYRAKNEASSLLPGSRKSENKTFVLSGDRGGQAECWEGEQCGAVGREGEPWGGGCQGVHAALLLFFYFFFGTCGFTSCSSGSSPTSTQPLGHWTSVLRNPSKRQPTCREQPHPWGFGEGGPREVCRAAGVGTGQGGEDSEVESRLGGKYLGQEGV